MTVSEFNNNEKQLNLENIIENLREQNDELRAENAKLQIQIEMYRGVGKRAEERQSRGDDPHILEEYKAATARMNAYFSERCDDMDAQS